MSHQRRLETTDRAGAAPAESGDPHHKLIADCAPHKGTHGRTHKEADHCKAGSLLPALTITNTDKQGANGKFNAADVIDEKTVDAVMRNEIAKRKTKDIVEDFYSAYISATPNFDIGPGKMSGKIIAELKRDPKYQAELRDADPYSETGAKKLISAYLHREAERFERGDYARGNEEAFNNARPGDKGRAIVRGNFNEMQQLWNEARKSNQPETLRKVLEESYNAGLRTDQIKQVESIRQHTSPDQVDVSKWPQKVREPVEDNTTRILWGP